MVPPTEPDPVAQGRPQIRLQTFREVLTRAGALGHRLPDLPPLFPFRLGESARDWALPYAFDDRIVALGSTAVDELFDLLADRRQAGIEPSQTPRYGLRRGIQPWATRLAASASEIDPHLDPALMEAWCDRSAGSLGEELTSAFTRAIEAELLEDGAPPFAMLMAVAAPTLAETLKGRVKSRTIRGMSYERLEKALGLALFSLIELSAQRAIREIERRPRPRDTRAATGRVRLCLNPLSYCSIRSRVLQNGLNPWWLSDELNELWGARRADELLTRPIDQLVDLALDQLLQDSGARARHAKAGRVTRLRHELLRLLWDFDRGPEEPWGQVRVALAQEDRLEELRRDAKGTLQKLQHAGVTAKALGGLQALLGGGGDLEDLQVALVAQVTYAIDRLVAEHTDRLARGLRDSRSEGDVRQLIALYDQGRLYRLSADPKPILHLAQRRTSGHLFVDLKGFTQRTVRAKEIVVADFLRREFYEPILRAAGSLNVNGGAEVKLLNLVGDAAAFAGEVPALVRLATEIRRLCNTYQRTLAGADLGASAGEDERSRRDLESRLAVLEEPLLLEASLLEGEIARKQAMTAEEREIELTRQLQLRASELAGAHREVRDKLAAADGVARGALEAEMLRLSESQESLAATARSTLERLAPAEPKMRANAVLELITTRERLRLEDLARAVRQAREQASREAAERRRLQRTVQGDGMEAGVFISFGAAPEEIRIEDPVFGEVRVSVAEKLNEAARGTGRSSKVAEEAAEALRRAMARSGNAQLRDPFAVHVGPTGTESATEIFNAGEAISGEALQVFLQRSIGDRFHFERVLRRAELAPEILEQLAVPDRLKLIVSLNATGSLSDALLFRNVGFVLFRGFEEGEGCDVYELLSSDQRFTKLLTQHHLQRWADEAKATPTQLLTGLPGR